MLGGGVGAGIGGLSGYNQWNTNKTEYEDFLKKQKAWDAELESFDPYALEVDSEAFKPVVRSEQNLPVSQKADDTVAYEPDMSYTQKGTAAGKRIRGEARMREIERERHNLQYELNKELQEIENRTDLDPEAKRLQAEALAILYEPRFKALQTKYEDALILREGGTPSLGEMYYDGAAALGWNPSVAWIPGSLNVVGGLPKAIAGNMFDWGVPGDHYQYAGYFQPKEILRHNQTPEEGGTLRMYAPQSATMSGSTAFTDRGQQTFLSLIRQNYSTQDAIDIIRQQEEKSPGTYYTPESYFDLRQVPQETVDKLVYDSAGERLPFRQAFEALSTYLKPAQDSSNTGIGLSQ